MEYKKFLKELHKIGELGNYVSEYISAHGSVEDLKEFLEGIEDSPELYNSVRVLTRSFRFRETQLGEDYWNDIRIKLANDD